MEEQFLTGRLLRVVTATHDLGSPWLVLWLGLGGSAEESWIQRRRLGSPRAMYARMLGRIGMVRRY